MRAQSGNALFLILIAVALFAALSYAVTRSGRGGGTVDRETAMVTAGQLTQHAAGIRTAITRMILTGTSAANVTFNGAGDGAAPLSAAPCDTRPDYCVFSTSGGGATVESGWSFGTTGGCNYITDVGTNTNITGADALAWYPNVTLAVCQQINKALGLGATVTDNAGALDELCSLPALILIAITALLAASSTPIPRMLLPASATPPMPRPLSMTTITP